MYNTELQIAARAALLVIASFAKDQSSRCSLRWTAIDGDASRRKHSRRVGMTAYRDCCDPRGLIIHDQLSHEDRNRRAARRYCSWRLWLFSNSWCERGSSR